MGRRDPLSRHDPSGSREGAVDRHALLCALQAFGWNVSRTAQALKVSRMTLYRWLRKVHIER